MDNYELWHDIFNTLDMKSMLALELSSSLFRKAFVIKNHIIKQQQLLCFFDKSQIRKIEIPFGLQINITDYNLNYLKSVIPYGMPNLVYMTNLKTLKIDYQCAVSNYMLKNLDLECLCISGNHGVTDLSHMKNLTKLKIKSPNLLLKQNAYKLTTLTQLYLIADSKEDMDFTALKNLKKLKIKNSYVANKIDLTGLDLYILKCKYVRMHKISFLKNLKEFKTINVPKEILADMNLYQTTYLKYNQPLMIKHYYKYYKEKPSNMMNGSIDCWTRHLEYATELNNKKPDSYYKDKIEYAEKMLRKLKQEDSPGCSMV